MCSADGENATEKAYLVHEDAVEVVLRCSSFVGGEFSALSHRIDRFLAIVCGGDVKALCFEFPEDYALVDDAR